MSNYNETEDYTCDLKFEDGKAKVKLVGKGKFEGMAVCLGTKEEAEVVEACGPKEFRTDSWDIIAEAVLKGDTSKYNVGDTKTVDLGDLGEHTLRIANKSTPTECGQPGFSQTACGFVIEFADVITSYNMNTKRTNKGGWEASAMRTYVNGTIYNALVSAIGDIIIPTTVVSGHGTLDEKNITTTDKLYILSPEEVYGKYASSQDTSIGTSRQLDYYIGKITSSDNSAAVKQGSWLWLRSALSINSCDFFLVRASTWNGSWSSNFGDYEYGVSPAFRLGQGND